MATIVAFHAHPDDEVLLTGGTLARLAGEGNRAVRPLRLVVRYDPQVIRVSFSPRSAIMHRVDVRRARSPDHRSPGGRCRQRTREAER